MPRFFLNNVAGDTGYITGDDARHIAKALRMQPGGELTASDMQGTDYRCRIIGLTPEIVTLQLLESYPCRSECPVPVRLYQAMPKGDKLEFVIQKAVELGAVEIIPVLTARCVARPGYKSMEKKLERFNRIAYEAAKQSGRGMIPLVRPLLPFELAISEMTGWDLPILLYEEEALPLGEVLAAKPHPKSVGLLVGSEGGFSPEEAAWAADQGVHTAGLGRRILRCETAPVAALAVLMYHMGEF